MALIMHVYLRGMPSVHSISYLGRFIATDTRTIIEQILVVRVSSTVAVHK
jgi:hypothetical protein